MNLNNPTFIRRALLVYFFFCFYHLGETLMTYFVNLAELVHVHEQAKTVFEIFSQKMFIFSQIPSILMLLATVSLLWFAPKSFTKWSVYLAIGLALISVSVGFFYIQPIYDTLPQTSLTPSVQAQLFPVFFWGKIIPATLQALIGFWWLNGYFGQTKPLPRWAFLVVFVLACFTMGTGTMEGYVAYPFWREIGTSDWLAARQAPGAAAFFGIFLIPGYLPMILTIVMFWHRPAGLSKWVPTAIIGLIVIVFVVTAAYFVPDLQMKLDEGYSRELIDELLKNDLPYRGWAAYSYVLLTMWAFTKVALNPQPLPPKTIS
jgi:hypothetical protein